MFKLEYSKYYISTLVTGRCWKGTAFGGWKSRTEVPRLVQMVMRGEMRYSYSVNENLEKIKI